jgi:predicted kinase
MKLIILRGKIGSGKTTLQNLIVKTFHFEKVEIDEIKIRKYGTTKTCVPSVDFKEAGLLAKRLLLDGHNVVVEEAFLQLGHIQFLLEGLENVKPSIIYIRLECSEPTAMNRKIGTLDLDKHTILGQLGRPVDNIDGELLFNTDISTSENIIEAIRDRLTN